jgi:hypothetical protein
VHVEQEEEVVVIGVLSSSSPQPQHACIERNGTNQWKTPEVALVCTVNGSVNLSSVILAHTSQTLIL